jgi:VanZ family protein
MSASRRQNIPQPPVAFRLTQRHFVGLAIAYGLAVVYCSLLLGPDGPHYVPLGLIAAWEKFRLVQFADNASDQRPDWIANMIMTIPLAYFVRGALPSRGKPMAETVRAAAAFAACVLFILVVKYAQLFFPPRTVTLNYIAGQSIGAALGVWLFALADRRLYPWLRDMRRAGNGLAIVLGVYSVLLTAYFLMPFDLALSPSDLQTRLFELPFSIVPGAGHSPAYRAILVLVDVAATVPVGMFLAVTGRELSFRALLVVGIGLIVPVTILTLFILSATPFALSLVSRTLGVALGIRFIWWLKGKDLWKRHYQFAGYVPVAAPIYVMLALLANGLLTGSWLRVDEAIRALDPRGLLPLWDLYIVSKAAAARHVVETLAMFAPIGAMTWLWRGFWSKGAGFAAFTAFVLSLSIEAGRAMKPGLTPSFSDPFLAAAAAAAAFRSMRGLWEMFEQEAKNSVHYDAFTARNGRAAQIFTNFELIAQPAARRERSSLALAASSTTHPAQARAGVDQLSAALRRIAALERNVAELAFQVESLRIAARRPAEARRPSA